MSNSIGQFEPIHAAHAIEQVVFVLQFDRALTSDAFALATESAIQFNTDEDLPALIPIEIPRVTFSFGIAGGNVQQTQPSGTTLGIILRRTAPNGAIAKELRVEPHAITFITSLYTRWDTIWAQANTYFNALIPKYIAGQANATGIHLNYLDKFVWNGDINNCNQNLLLRPGSNYLCPNVFGVDDLWHSHTGAFIRVDNKVKRLLNINVDCLDENRPEGLRRVVAVTTVLSDQLNQPGYEPYDFGNNDTIEFVNTHMRTLHELGIDVFTNIINDEMCRRIALIE